MLLLKSYIELKGVRSSGTAEYIRSGVGKDSIKSGEDVEVHALAEGISALHFVGFAGRMHVKVVAHVFLLYLLATLVHQQHPVRIGPVISSSDAVPELAETHMAGRLLKTPSNY